MLKNLLVLISFSFVLISCGDKKNEPENTLTDKEKYSFDSTDLKTEGVDNSGNPFVMEYKFKKGDKITYRLTTIADNAQTISTDTTITMNVTQKIIYLINLDTKDIDKDGIAEVEFNIGSLKLEAVANGQKYDFEAGKDSDSAKINQYAEFYSLYQNPFTARFNKSGEVLEIFRADRISNKYLELRGIADSISTEEKNLVKQDLVNGVLKQLVTQLIRRWPDKVLYTDSTWDLKQPPITMMVFQLNYINKYKMESVDKLDNNRLAVINAGMEYTVNGNPNVTQGNVIYNFKKPVSTADGKIFFNVDKGLLQKSRTKTKVEISYTMEAMTPKGKQKGLRKEVVFNTNILELL